MYEKNKNTIIFKIIKYTMYVYNNISINTLDYKVK